MAELIYVVDDESIIATTLAAILNSSGFDAKSFTDPTQALSAAGAQCPDILISDVAMPQMNGVQLATHIKAVNPTCKILLFSGQAATRNLLDAARDEGHDFVLLSKPIHPTDLLAAIRKKTIPVQTTD